MSERMSEQSEEVTDGSSHDTLDEKRTLHDYSCPKMMMGREKKSFFVVPLTT